MTERWWIEDDCAVMMEFEGEPAQIVMLNETRWTYPDGGKTARLREGRSKRGRLIAAAPEQHEALKPFAQMCEFYSGHSDDCVILFGTDVNITVGDLRQARAARAKASGESEASARFSAAAPEQNVTELLEALEETLELLCHCCRRLNPQHVDCRGCQDTERARAAIAKATTAELSMR